MEPMLQHVLESFITLLCPHSTHTHPANCDLRRDSGQALPSVNITALCHRPNAAILAYHIAAAAAAIRLCLCKQMISRLIPVKAH